MRPIIARLDPSGRGVSVGVKDWSQTQMGNMWSICVVCFSGAVPGGWRVSGHVTVSLWTSRATQHAHASGTDD